MLCKNSNYLVCFEDTLTQNCFTTTFKAEKQQKQPIAKPSPNHRRVRTSTFSFACQFSENSSKNNIFIAGKASLPFPSGKMLKSNYFKGLKRRILKERKRE